MSAPGRHGPDEPTRPGTGTSPLRNEAPVGARGIELCVRGVGLLVNNASSFDPTPLGAYKFISSDK